MDSHPKETTITPTLSTISTASTAVDAGDSPERKSKHKFIDGLLPPPPTLPNDHDRRTLVLCFDGTGDSYDDDNSNVLDFFSMLKKDNPGKQVVYYQTGVGISPAPRYVTTIANGVQKATDEALATSLDDHVQQGYGFIVQNYKYGDKICLFGFSRGAYTARALAGMLHKVGLLPKNNAQHIPFAYDMYKREEKDWRHSNNFKSAFSIDVKVEFVGVWDTVSSVGIWPSTLPFTSSNKSIRYFRHAIALDERRAKFQPNPWNEPTKADQRKGIDQNTTSTEVLLNDTNVKEVWFSGCHCDVGGGSVKNDTPHALAKNPLRWMIRECFKAGTGIMFYEKGLKRIGFDVTSPNLGEPYVAPFSPGINQLRTQKDDEIALEQVQQLNALQTQAQADAEQLVDTLSFATEQEQEVLDALSPIYDQLSLKWTWYILEAVPFKRGAFQKDPNDGTLKSTDTRWPNFGNGRVIPPPRRGQKTLVHRSVKTRMDAVDKDGKRAYEGIQSLKEAIERDEVKWVE